MTRASRRLLSFLMLSFFFIMVGTAVLGRAAGGDGIVDAWFAMVGICPFGKTVAQIALNVFSELGSATNSLSKYTAGFTAYNVIEMCHDLVTLLIATMLYEAVNNGLQIATGVKDKDNFANFIGEACISMVSVVLCTLGAMAAMNFFFSQLGKLSAAAQGAWYAVVMTLGVGGLIAVMFFVLGQGILVALLYVAVKVLAMNMFKFALSYFTIFLILLFIGEKAYLKVAAVSGGWLVLIIMLVGIDLMFTSAMKGL